MAGAFGGGNLPIQNFFRRLGAGLSGGFRRRRRPSEEEDFDPNSIGNTGGRSDRLPGSLPPPSAPQGTPRRGGGPNAPFGGQPTRPATPEELAAAGPQNRFGRPGTAELRADLARQVETGSAFPVPEPAPEPDAVATIDQRSLGGTLLFRETFPTSTTLRRGFRTGKDTIAGGPTGGIRRVATGGGGAGGFVFGDVRQDPQSPLGLVLGNVRDLGNRLGVDVLADFFGLNPFDTSAIRQWVEDGLRPYFSSNGGNIERATRAFLFDIEREVRNTSEISAGLDGGVVGPNDTGDFIDPQFQSILDLLAGFTSDDSAAAPAEQEPELDPLVLDPNLSAATF